jgi:hypothetical protein
MPQEIKGGLQELPQDIRDFELGALYDLPELESLPLSFLLPYTVKHQGDSDFCSAYTSCAVSEVQEGIELEPSYSFAVSKVLKGGDVDSFGCDLRNAMKAHVKTGALPSSISPYSLKNKSDHFLRRLENWRVNEKLPAPYKKKTYFKITGQYDHFDNIRASLYKFKTPVAIGIQYGYRLSDIYFDEVKNGTGHAMTVIGYKDAEYLIVLNSYGSNAGLGGTHYIHRKVVNHWAPFFGAYTFTDLTKEEVQHYLKSRTKAETSHILRMIRRGIRRIKDSLGMLSQ